MKEVLRFNTTDKKLEDRLKDCNSKGLVFNTLKARELYYKKLEKFRAANPTFLDDIQEDLENRNYIDYSKFYKFLYLNYSDGSSFQKDLVSAIVEEDFHECLIKKGKLKGFRNAFDYENLPTI
jgi:hypothetical protein